MPITITINGENADQVLSELKVLSRELVKHTVEWKFLPTKTTPSENDVRMAADLPETEMVDVTFKDGTTERVEVVEDKPKRKRRTKEEMEAERAEGLPPQEGDPDLDPVVEEVVSDLLDEETAPTEPTTKAATRGDVQERLAKLISQRLLTPAEIRAVFVEHGGSATNAASLDEKFAGAMLAGFDAAVAAKGA